MCEVVISNCSNNPLHKAISLVGGPRAIQESEHLSLITNRLPQAARGQFVTGLSGRFTQQMWVRHGTHPNPATWERYTFPPDSKWTIRWDYDPAKKSHINVSVSGAHQSVRFAILAASIHNEPDERYAKAVRDLSQVVQWNGHEYKGDARFLANYWANRHDPPPPRWGYF
jgi:hypothetical protein